MRKKSIFLLLIVFLFLNVASIFTFLLPTTATTNVPISYEPIDIGSRLRKSELELNLDLEIKGAPKSSGLKTSADPGDFGVWLWLDDTVGLYLAWYELRGVGTNCELWVMTSLSWADPNDPRPVPVITDQQVNYLIDEFDNNIYPSVSTYFGEEDFHDGSNAVQPYGYYDPEGKTVILVSNIGDENYYDPTYPYYIAGFYWGAAFEYHTDRNVISIDAYDWENRIGPDAARPNMYEGVFAHEFQHLIHDDYFEISSTFMNEGSAMFSEVLCGYPTDWSSINSFFATPDNSLTVWEDQGGINTLADYGQVFLWATYLVDNYGDDFLKNYVANGVPGVEGVNDLLALQGTSFEEVFQDWTIDNFLRTGYAHFDFNDPAADAVALQEIKQPWAKDVLGSDFGTTITILGYDTGVTLLGSYGTDYIAFTNVQDRHNPVLVFDGDDVVGVASWIRSDMDGDGDLEWYSTPGGDEADLTLTAEVDLTGKSSLTFDTYTLIEPLWDFGFVQISTDSGVSWTSLENEDTTWDYEEGAYPTIVENLPGFTGYSDGWFGTSFDVSGFTGLVLLRFRLMTDWVYNDPGWLVDDIKLDGVLIDNADDIVVFEVPPIPEVDFKITLVSVEIHDGLNKIKDVVKITPNDLTETFNAMLTDLVEDGFILLIVSSTLGPAEYSFSVVRSEMRHGNFII